MHPPRQWKYKYIKSWTASVIFSFKSLLPTMCDCFSTVSGSLFSVVSACLNAQQQVIPEGLLIFVWVLQHSIKLFKYAQGYLSKLERLWTYMSPSNRYTDYGLQLAPRGMAKTASQPGADVAGLQCTIISKGSGGQSYCNNKLRTVRIFSNYLPFADYYQYRMVVFKSAECILHKRLYIV